MRVLIGCESSGVVRRAFAARGHVAVSVDLLPAKDGATWGGGAAIGAGHIGYHWQGDVMDVLGGRAPFDVRSFDLGIFHPDCTYLTWSAEWAYGDGPYHMKLKPGTLVGAARRRAREDAADFAERLWRAPIKRVAVENPRGYLTKRLGPETQTIQPNWFGADASKATCLWLRELRPLVATELVALPAESGWLDGFAPAMSEARPRVVDGLPRWANQTDSGQNRLSPSDDRWQIRSETYPGVAAAMADQWGW